MAVAMLIAGCGAAQEPKSAPGKVIELSTAEVRQMLDEGKQVTVLDVREDSEFKEGHIPGAKLIPLGTLSSRLQELNPKEPVIVVCRSGNRSAQGAEILAKAGFQTVYNMAGGMSQWKGKVEK